MGRADDNLAVIRRIYEAFATRDTNVIQELLAPDVTISQSPELPWGGEYEATTARSRSSSSSSSTSSRR